MVLCNDIYNRAVKHDVLLARSPSKVYFFEGDDLIGTGQSRPRGLRPINSHMYVCTCCGETWGRVLIEHETSWTIEESPCTECDSRTCNNGNGPHQLFQRHALFLGSSCHPLDGIIAPVAVVARDFLHLMHLFKI